MEKKYNFYFNGLRYFGRILKENETHLIIFDDIKKKEFHIPKRGTVLEEVK